MRSKETEKLIDLALQEDKSKSDITTKTLIDPNAISTALIIAKEDAIVCGLDVARRIFHRIDERIVFRSLSKDGRKVSKKSKIIFLKGKTHSLLAGERVVLNFLSHLSGIATQTNRFVGQIRPYKAKIMDTRKTIPGLRQLAKYAVRCGGGFNHRLTLNDMILIKDNHLAAKLKKMPLQEIVRYAKKVSEKPVEVEVETVRDFKEALLAHPAIILLDNMNLKSIIKAVGLAKSRPKHARPLLEVSGNVSLKNVRDIAKAGVDRISIGSLTHSVKAIDFSLELSS